MCKILKINNTMSSKKKKHVKNPLLQIKNKREPSQGWLKNIIKRRTDQYGFYVDNRETRGTKHLRTITDNPPAEFPDSLNIEAEKTSKSTLKSKVQKDT